MQSLRSEINLKIIIQKAVIHGFRVVSKLPKKFIVEFSDNLAYQVFQSNQDDI